MYSAKGELFQPRECGEVSHKLRILPKSACDMKLLYQNTRAHRVRFLQIVLWALAFGVPALLYGQVHAGSRDDALLMAVITPILLLFAVGMEIYLRCYVVRLVEMPEGLEVTTMSTLGRQSHLRPWSDMKVGRNLHERFIGGTAPSVNNTSTLLNLADRRLPLIIDTTIDDVDLSSLRRRKQNRTSR